MRIGNGNIDIYIYIISGLVTAEMSFGRALDVLPTNRKIYSFSKPASNDLRKAIFHISNHTKFIVFHFMSKSDL